MPTQLTPQAITVLEKRYLQKNAKGELIETPDEMFRRVANNIARAEHDYCSKDGKHITPAACTEYQEYKEKFYQLMSNLDFLPNSPTLVNAGTNKGCLSACFTVSPEDTMESIMQVAHDAAMIEKWGGGIGFGLSQLRPKGDSISTTHGMACGPIAVMKLYSAVGATITQGAFRLGAHMAQLICSHPDIREFIHCKDGDDALSNFNISVQVTDAFMEAVRQNLPWDLVNPRNGKVTETISAQELWQEICESAWKTGDPGIVFMDRVWETAPNPQLGKIQTSNPCGEEFLEQYGNCCLGSINLDKHIFIANKGFSVDWEKLRTTINLAVRFLDDVITVNQFPLPQLREMNLATRRIGLGVMGWADMLVRLSIPYDSEDAMALADKMGQFINWVAWSASEDLAKERGAFPEYPNSALKDTLARKGIGPVRNSSVITVAPTGSIARIAGCSSGIEPHFALAWWSNVLWTEQNKASTRLLDAPTPLWDVLPKEEIEQMANHPAQAGYILIRNGQTPDFWKTAMEISPESHVNMQAVWQQHATNSISKTINLRNTATVEDVDAAFTLAYLRACKAVTVYRDGSKGMQVLETGDTKRESNEQTSLQTSVIERSDALVGTTYKQPSPFGNLYITINGGEEPLEVFVNAGKSGADVTAMAEAIGRLASLVLRLGSSRPRKERLTLIAEQLKGIGGSSSVGFGNGRVRSIPDGVAKAILKHTQQGQPILVTSERVDIAEYMAQTLQSYTLCPECGNALVYQEGCALCLSCGFSQC